jgi:hypothetical protein
MNHWSIILSLIAFIGFATPTSASSTLEPDAIHMELRPVIHMTGEVGRPYILQFSENLATPNWNVATNFFMPRDGFDFVIPAGFPASQQFYRAIPGTIIASSAADFSGVQGSNNWFYGYFPGPFTPTNFLEFDHFDGSTWKPANLNVWTEVRQTDQHPNGVSTSFGKLSVEHWAVRRWRSPMTQKINISLFIRDRNEGIGNGIVARIFLDGVEQSNYLLGDGGQRWESLTLDVQAGSLLDFVVDPREANDWRDSTELRAVIY